MSSQQDSLMRNERLTARWIRSLPEPFQLVDISLSEFRDKAQMDNYPKMPQLHLGHTPNRRCSRYRFQTGKTQSGGWEDCCIIMSVGHWRVQTRGRTSDCPRGWWSLKAASQKEKIKMWGSCLPNSNLTRTLVYFHRSCTTMPSCHVLPVPPLNGWTRVGEC